MADINNKNISETPHSANIMNPRSSQASYESVDSGYFALTPNSASTSGGMTPIIGGYRNRGCLASSKRHYRTRTDPLQSDYRGPRNLRSKFNSLINSTDQAYSSPIIDESLEDPNDGISQDSGNFSVEQTSCERNSSVDHSTSEKRDLSAELRDRRTRNRRIWQTTVPITPATRLQLLSPPPSPAVPSSSYIATEPIEDNVKMKLVIVPQSTPNTVSSNCIDINISCLNYSPTTRRKSPIGITSVENTKLRNLMITDVSSIADIVPKRLDFSQRALSYALHRTRATPDYTGKDTVDLMSLLGEKSNHWRVVSKILSHLSSQDLCSVSMVSQAWRRICANDSRANMRRLSHIILRQNAKENLKIIRKNKANNDAINSSPKNCYVRRGYLREVHNLLQVPTTPKPPNSPPVSPSKVKFHSFVKASRTLEPWEHLLPCPNCSFPSHVDGENNVGKCSRQSCSMEFCTSCSSRPHSGPCKTPLLATPTKRNKRLIAGSRQSKRNLRRL